MKHRLQGIAIGVVATLTLLGGITAIAAPNVISRSIEVFFGGYTVYVDGTPLEATDTQGNRLEPFAYNGYMYVPAEEIARAFGKGVNWVQESGSLYLGEQPGVVQYMTDVLPAYQSSDKSHYKEYSFQQGGGIEKFDLSGNTYFDGFTIKGGPDEWYLGNYWVVWNLNGQYTTFSGMLGHVDGASSATDGKLQVFCDGILKSEIVLKSDMLAMPLSINVAGVRQLKFSWVVGSTGTLATTAYGVGNPVLQ